MDRTGGCACGAIRFRLNAPFIAMGACHCRDCQKASGGGPNYVALVPADGFAVTRGEARVYRTRADSGAEARRFFCPDCGTPLWSELPDDPMVAVRVGALDDDADFAPALHVFTASAPAWHPMDPALPRFPKMPPSA